MDKRSFIKKFSLLGFAGVPGMKELDQWLPQFKDRSPEQLAGDENFWDGIRKGYKLKPDYINLENGYYCFMPTETLEHYLNHIREVNYKGSYYMRTVQWDNKKKVAAKLAEIAGCSPEELIVTRNATESLDTIIGGMHWNAGDEAVMAEQDYESMLDMFKLVAQRYAVINRVVSVPNHPASDEEIVNLYANALNSKTRLLMIGHMINITGHILPVQKICDMAHSKGVKVMVDGAHAFAHIKFSIPDLHCDYYGASLHKWLSVPLGAGILYVKKENIPGVWPLIADGDSKKESDIYRLNHTGTHPVATDLAIANAVDYYLKIGAERKEERLRYLQNYWTSLVRNHPNIVVNTPAENFRACGIANVGIASMKPADLAEALYKKYRIYTVAIDYANVKGCRITPNIYTIPKELDHLVTALKELAG